MSRPLFSKTEQLGRIGVAHVQMICAQAGQIFRETPNSDIGIDGHIEFVNEQSEPTGEVCAVQIKFSENGYQVDLQIKHLLYWLVYPLPVIIIFVTNLNLPTGKFITLNEIADSGINASQKTKSAKGSAPFNIETLQKNIFEYTKKWIAVRVPERGAAAYIEMRKRCEQLEDLAWNKFVEELLQMLHERKHFEEFEEEEPTDSHNTIPEARVMWYLIAGPFLKQLLGIEFKKTDDSDDECDGPPPLDNLVIPRDHQRKYLRDQLHTKLGVQNPVEDIMVSLCCNWGSSVTDRLLMLCCSLERPVTELVSHMVERPRSVVNTKYNIWIRALELAAHFEPEKSHTVDQTIHFFKELPDPPQKSKAITCKKYLN